MIRIKIAAGLFFTAILIPQSGLAECLPGDGMSTMYNPTLTVNIIELGRIQGAFSIPNVDMLSGEDEVVLFERAELLTERVQGDLINHFLNMGCSNADSNRLFSRGYSGQFPILCRLWS